MKAADVQVFSPQKDRYYFIQLFFKSFKDFKQLKKHLEHKRAKHVNRKRPGAGRGRG